MPKPSSRRNSMSGRQTRDFTIKDVNDLETENLWTNEMSLTPEANKIMKIVQNAPVGTEITLNGTNHFFLKSEEKPYQEKYRVSGTLRNKIIEPLGEYSRYSADGRERTILKKMPLNKESFINIFSGSPDHSLANTSLKIHMRKTPKTSSEKKAQKEESAIERRQLKLFR